MVTPEITKNYFYVSLKPEELENGFRIESFAHDKTLTKTIIVISLITTILFIGLELSLFPSKEFRPLWILSRIVAAIASLIGLGLIQRQTDVQRMDRITFVWGLIIICHMLIINATRINAYIPVILWDILVILGIYFWLPTPHHHKICLAFFLTSCSGAIWCLYRKPIVSLYETAAVLAAYLIANVYGVLLSWQENQRRRQNHVLSNTDYLTGVSNRRHFFHQIPRELERAQRYGNPLSLLIFDIDNLKEVNDQHGHTAGDELIKAFAKQCSAQLRAFDQFARFGGDEFIALLINTGQEEAREIALRIRKIIEELRIHIENGTVTTTVSIGLTTTRDGEISFDKFVKEADKALYEAKDNGKNQIASR